MNTPVQDKLRQFYERFSGNDQVLVVINADPDAIASSMAVRRLLWRKVHSVTVSHVNNINRPDNLAMIRLLGQKLVPFSDIDPAKFSRTVIVDSQPSHHKLMEPLKPDVIIDHHPQSNNGAPLTDIRPKYGATATIMIEYLRAARIKPSTKLATALYHGIKTDTNEFKGPFLVEDVKAFQYIFRYVNIHLASKFEQVDLRYDYLKHFRTALQNMRRRKSKIYAHLGQVTNDDVCVLIADFFMRVNSVTWSIVSGICNKKLTIIFRNDGIRKNAGNVAQEGFGKFGSAGGHKNMARAEIMLTQLKDQVDSKDDEKVLNWIINRTARRAEKK